MKIFSLSCISRRSQQAFKIGRLAVSLLLVSFLLSGCLYGGQVVRENAPASGEYMLLVQNAIEQYQQRTGVLPIKTRDSDTPVYEKYHIDFKKLQDSGLLSLIPTNSFENGGTAIYVLVNVETEPTVKLLDLVSYQAMAKMQQQVSEYIHRNGSLPAAEQMREGLYWLDVDKLGRNAQNIKSPITGQTLPVLINEAGKLFIDYTLDFSKLLSSTEVERPAEGSDLREFLVAQSNFVPVWSLPYQLVGEEPVINLE